MRLFFAICFWGFSISFNAQVYRGIDLSEVPSFVAPLLDNAILKQRELQRRTSQGKSSEIYFAKAQHVDLNPLNSGVWVMGEHGKTHWVIKLISSNAHSLNLGFTQFRLPSSASLEIISADLKSRLPVFTSKDNEVHQQLWTPIVHSDALYVILSVEQQQKQQVKLQLSSLNHDFMGFAKASSQASGSCNLDVACSDVDGFAQVDNYRDIIQSVATTTKNGVSSCTGFLVNNTAQDCRPYFMTADHCNFTAASASTLVAYWNYQNSICRPVGSAASGANGDGQLIEFNSGSVLRATSSLTDFTLLELDDPVLETANCFFAGWDRSADVPTSAIAIHHPRSEEKRISFENDALVISDANRQENANGNYLKVIDWDLGTTEGGSSGSPLFNQDKRVVGQLFGGTAACGNDDPDAYGWFHKSWEGQGDSTSRLKDWLDPLSLGLSVLDGKFNTSCLLFSLSPSLNVVCQDSTLVIDITAGVNFSDTVYLSLQDTSIVYAFQDDTLQVGLSTQLNIETSSLNFGQNDILIQASDSSETYTEVLSVYLLEDQLPSTTFTFPANQQENVLTTLQLTWNAVQTTEQYRLQIALDSMFSNLFLDTLVSDSNCLAGLQANTQYYARVLSQNKCAQSNFSELISFTTANELCVSYSATDLPLLISSGPANMNISELPIGQSGTISKIEVRNVTGNHTFMADLHLYLEHPDQTQATLFADICGGSSFNFNVSFSDLALANIACPFDDGQTVFASDALDIFSNKPLSGTWKLYIDDQASGDGGELTNWELYTCFIAYPNSVEQSLSTGQIQVFPNPTKSIIQLKSIEENLTNAQIFDITGALVVDKSLSSKQEQLNSSNLSQGIYTLVVYSAQRKQVFKIIKE